MAAASARESISPRPATRASRRPAASSRAPRPTARRPPDAPRRAAAAAAFSRVAEVDVAITADLGTLQRLPRLIPEGIVRELAYTGRRMGAEEAARLGLVNRVEP